MMSIRRTILGVVLLASAWPSAAAPENNPTKTPEQIVARQRQILEQLRELEARLAKLATTLESTEPDKAERLTAALRESGQRRIAPRLQKIVTALEANAWGDAEHEQELLLKDLEALLNVLSEARDNLDELQAQRERLRRQREALAKMFDQQLDLRTDLASRDLDQAMARRLGELADNLGRLAERQEATTGQDDAKTQADLKSVAEALKKNLAEQQEKALDTQQKAALETAEAATNAAQQAMQSALEQMKPSSKSGQPPQSGEPANDQQQSANNQQESSDNQQAPSNESANSPQSSQSSQGARLAQEQATQQLRNAEAALRQSAEQAPPEDELRRIERLQRDLQSQADQLHQQMSPRNQSQGQQPGAPQTGRAAEHMQQAADALSEEASPEAQAEQDAALAELQKALDELDEALRQVRREERAEMLAGIESRLRAIIHLETQVRDAVASATKRLAIGELPALDEPEKMHTQAVSETDALHRLLLSEGTVVVLPNLLAYVLEDMRAVQPLLSAEKLSATVEGRLDNIIAQLEQLLDAVSQQRERDQENNMNQPPNQPQASNPDTQPLLQRSAELKLLRTAQISINDLSTSLNEGPVHKALANMLSERQTELAKLTLRLIETE